MFVDRTKSRIGQQYLYDKLRFIPLSEEDNFRNEWLIQELSNNPDFRFNIQKKLNKINHADAYYITSIFQDEHLKPAKWFFVTNYCL